jgi:hypothetical protein
LVLNFVEQRDSDSINWPVHWKYKIFWTYIWEPGSSVSLVSGYVLDDRAIDVRSPAGAEDFSCSLLCPDRLWGPPSLLCIMGTRGPFPRGKAWPGHDADHSPPFSAEVVNE